MATRSECKESILAVERILTERPQSCPTILRRLEKEYGIVRERKSVYDDIAVLTRFLPIEYIPRKGYVIRRIDYDI